MNLPGILRRKGPASGFEKAARTAGTAFSIGATVAIAGLVYLRLHGSAVLERRMEGWLTAHGWRAKVARILIGFSRGVQTIRTWGDVFAAVFYSLLHWFLVVFCYFLIIKSFGGRLGTLTFSDSMLVLVFTLVGSAVQLPGVGGGSQALSIVAFTRLYGVGNGSGGGGSHGALADYVCVVLSGRRAAVAARRIVAGRSARVCRNTKTKKSTPKFWTIRRIPPSQFRVRWIASVLPV